MSSSNATLRTLVYILLLAGSPRVFAEPAGTRNTSTKPYATPKNVISRDIQLDADLHVSGVLSTDQPVDARAGIRFPDGTIQVTAATETPSRTVVEVPAGADPVANGDALLTALDQIGDAAPDKRYLVTLDPGDYDLGSDSLYMKPWISLEGSGEALTRIVATGRATQTEATVITADNAGLSRMTVENTGQDVAAVAIFANTTSTRIEHVTAVATGGQELNYGLRIVEAAPRLSGVTAFAEGGQAAYAVSIKNVEELRWNDGRAVALDGVRNFGILVLNEIGPSEMQVVLDDVTAEAVGGEEGYGLYVKGPASARVIDSTLTVADATVGYGLRIAGIPSPIPVRIEGSTISATGLDSYGVDHAGRHFLRIDQSRVSGETHSVSVAIGETLRVGASRLEGGPVEVKSGLARCAGSYDGNYDMLPGTCL